MVENKKFDLAEDHLKVNLKKEKDKKKAWLSYIEFMIEWRKHEVSLNLETEKIFEDKIKTLIKRALQSLDKRDHIYFLNRCSIAEYRSGNFEVARMNYENILVNFPKRTDLWGVYLDMEIKHVEDQIYIRELFERICSLPLKTKIGKSFFKRFLNYENRCGDSESQMHVKKLAQKFVRNLSQQN